MRVTPLQKLNIAHRGARSLAPENTLVAAKKAYEAGADLWELDVQLTQDKKLIVMHDDTLARTTNAEEVFPRRESYSPQDFTLAGIKRLDAGSWFAEVDPFNEIEKGNVSQNDLKSYRGTKVPTLREALEVTRDLGFQVNIEIKGIDSPNGEEGELKETISTKVISLIESLDMESDVVVSSFDSSIVGRAGKLNSSIRRAIVVEEPKPNPLKLLRELDVQNYNLSKSGLKTKQGMTNIKEISRADDSNYGVIVWTVNASNKLKELVTNSCIRGIITDYPQRLSQILTEIA